MESDSTRCERRTYTKAPVYVIWTYTKESMHVYWQIEGMGGNSESIRICLGQTMGSKIHVFRWELLKMRKNKQNGAAAAAGRATEMWPQGPDQKLKDMVSSQTPLTEACFPCTFLTRSLLEIICYSHMYALGPQPKMTTHPQTPASSGSETQTQS
jgi:hypothetical protein